MKNFYYEGKDFYINGKKTLIMSGAIHYFRVPRQYWRDRLTKLYECGLNTVETYVPWNLHEKEEGEFDFSDNLDLADFIDLANEIGLYAIVRPGPYICAEWEGGGLPYWLKNYPDMVIRSHEKTYLDKITPYLTKVCKILSSRLIKNGGNVLMVQIENEYGGYGNDKEYLTYLKDLYNKLIPSSVLFTSDGANKNCLENGTLDDVLVTVNFGSNVPQRMSALADFRKDQPYMCAEYWCGWFDHWGGEHIAHPLEEKVECIENFLQNGYSFNMYMFHGGTNFAFSNGANICDDGSYQPTVTSYDYDGVLNESGDRTEFYYKIRELISSYTKKTIPLTAKDSNKISYGKIEFDSIAYLKDNLDNIAKKFVSQKPLFFEESNQAYGYMYYKTNLQQAGNITIDIVHDRAILLSKGIKQDIYYRNDTIPCVFNNVHSGEIGILVENLGRINFGHKMLDNKGIKGVKIDGKEVKQYECFSLPMNNLDKLQFNKLDKNSFIKNSPAFYKAKFNIDIVADTFLKTTAFDKGFVLINGINIGRFFNISSPTKTLYIPSTFLKKGINELILFDSDGLSKTDKISVEFCDHPQL